MDKTVEEVVAEIEKEIQDLLDANIVGIMPLNQKTMMLAISQAQELMNRSLPKGLIAHAINPRIEGTMIVWDGWTIERA